MATPVALIFMAATFLTTSSVMEASRQFKVGDAALGWHQPDPLNPAFYTQWAESNRFQIGDSLEFEYQNDSVLTVEKWDYYHCDATDPTTAFDNGKSIINLDRSGPFYFISGFHDHCISGQRLIVDVMSPHPIVASPPSIPPDDDDHAYSSLSPQLLTGPSPSSSSSSSSPSNSASQSVLSSSSVVLTSDFVAVLVVFVVMLLH